MVCSFNLISLNLYSDKGLLMILIF